jgi:hypothetical protein
MAFEIEKRSVNDVWAGETNPISPPKAEEARSRCDVLVARSTGACAPDQRGPAPIIPSEITRINFMNVASSKPDPLVSQST